MIYSTLQIQKHVSWVPWDSKLFPCCVVLMKSYRQTYNINGTLVGNEIVNHADVVGAAPTTSSLSI